MAAGQFCRSVKSADRKVAAAVQLMLLFFSGAASVESVDEAANLLRLRDCSLRFAVCGATRTMARALTSKDRDTHVTQGNLVLEQSGRGEMLAWLPVLSIANYFSQAS
jgi:hypothetical protein